MKFRSRVDEIDAERWTTHDSLRSADSLLNYVLRAEDVPERLRRPSTGVCVECQQPLERHGWLIALGGNHTHRVCPNNWVYREGSGILEGEVYAISDESLDYRYEPVPEPDKDRPVTNIDATPTK